jgi:outer membrane protein OmpA-like peptidoglycan-associated protein
MFKQVSIMIFVLLFLSACSKTTVVLLDSGKSQNSIFVSNDTGKVTLDKVGNYVDLAQKDTKISSIKNMSPKEIEDRFSKALASEPLKPMTYILYFKTNSTELTEASEETLKSALKSIEERSPCMVDIIGHTDTVGSNEMNAKVSLERAKSIESLIIAQKLKIKALVAKGYGEEDLLVATKDEVNEAKNRNVEIFIK